MDADKFLKAKEIEKQIEYLVNRKSKLSKVIQILNTRTDKLSEAAIWHYGDRMFFDVITDDMNDFLQIQMNRIEKEIAKLEKEFTQL